MGDDDWYPGDDCVDIVARDGYPKGNTEHSSQASDFKRLREAHPNKMTALPECNSVPSWENMQRDGALWLMLAPGVAAVPSTTAIPMLSGSSSCQKSMWLRGLNESYLTLMATALSDCQPARSERRIIKW